MDVWRHRERVESSFDDGPRVVVALNDEDADAVLVEELHLFANVNRRVKVGTVFVVEVAGDQQKVNLFVDCQLNEIVERLARGDAQGFGRSTFVLIEILQRAVEMDIGSMDELEHAFLFP